jgi:cell division protein FtsB
MEVTPLNRVGHTYWLSNRQITPQSSAQALPALSARDISREIFPATVGWLGLIPSWIILGMILLATLAICSTVIMRTRAEAQASAIELQSMRAEVETSRQANEALQIEIRRMTSDPNMIETAARARLGMVRPNDVVVPVESIQHSSSLGTLSFVR